MIVWLKICLKELIFKAQVAYIYKNKNMLKQLKINRISTKLAKICSFFKIDASFFVVLIISVFLDETSFYMWYLIFMLLHELSHFFVAKKLGYYPTKIRLGIFGAKLEGYDDFVLNDEIKIVLAGPLFNLLIIVLVYLSFWFNPESYDFLHDILIANWVLFIFNSLPVFPLDCGRIILALFSLKLNRESALKRTKIISFFMVGLLFVFYLFSLCYGANFTFGFAVVNLAFMCLSSTKDTSYKRGLFAKRKFDRLSSGLIERNIYISDEVQHYKLFKYIDDSHFVNFVFLSKDLTVTSKLSEVEFYKENNLI